MPHIVVEYTANLAEHLDVRQLLTALHRAACASGHFLPSSVRTRAIQLDDYLIGDEHASNSMVHIVARVRPRSDSQLRELGATLMEAVTGQLQQLQERLPLGITLEVQQIDVAHRFLLCNLEEFQAKRKPE
ncbi:5-carboxymethyl-2-hydroxymuconate Delta-isomerase [Ramlibacter sp. AW1]|uniref:5-carboxymethyl-2-hydroxymuconate Delta-isomerase n=1 Tax=Ramlibacter aurantiacus TaxID=2801330 RepID=A0A936ZSG2_9BURK|nr:5-carboxymethyl-2-hydroxymuconate Delta-isomerase [Ramlibacter aurantiacus]MBL0422628.1 5-carboxymethyl-2-hydroxymuconate Delta-isomerase [Ramlibacter aurantiacus]